MTLKVAKSQLSRRRMDWCIHELLEDVLLHYWYQSLKNNWCFVLNEKQGWFVVNVVICVKEIPNSYVTFLEDDGGYAIVASLTHEHLNYKVYNLESDWAYFECF